LDGLISQAMSTEMESTSPDPEQFQGESEGTGKSTSAERRSGTKFTGTEPIFGAFTHSSTVIASIRLTHAGKIFSPVNEVSSAITSLAREFRFKGDSVRTLQEMQRIRGMYNGRVQAWRQEEARRLNQKKSMNGNQLRDMEKELNRVNLDISRGDTVFNRMVNDLDLITRTGDECPLVRPQKKVVLGPLKQSNKAKTPAKPKVSKTWLSLRTFFDPDGLMLSFRTAAFVDDFDDTLREHCFEKKNYVSILNHWSNRDPNTRERGNLYLRTWIIPKSVDALFDLEKILPKLRFSIEMMGKGNQSTSAETHRKHDLVFQTTDLSTEKTIVEKRLNDYLHDIAATNFEHKRLLVRRPFEFYFADYCSDIPFETAIQFGFKLQLHKK
jgi:hypothetical protein